MTKFTIIDGGGEGRPPRSEFHTARARETLGTLIIELLRALARGDDNGMRVTDALIDFYKHASQSEAPLGLIVEDKINRSYERALAHVYRDDSVDAEIRDICQAALRVVAEALAPDTAAKGRKSSREDALRKAIERHVLESEKRSRSYGWSYTGNLTAGLGEWPPPKPKATTRHSGRKPKS